MRLASIRFYGAGALLWLAAASVAVAQTGPQLQISTSDGSVQAGDNVAFPDTATGNASAPLVITIRNAGESDLTFDGDTPVTVSGDDADLFAVSTQPTGPVAAGDSATFTIVFTPSSAGSHTASITIQSNDSATPSFTFSVSGAGS